MTPRTRAYAPRPDWPAVFAEHAALTNVAIGALLGVHEVSVSKARARLGLAPAVRAGKGRAWTVLERAKARALFDSGLTFRAIGEAIGRPVQSVEARSQIDRWPKRKRGDVAPAPAKNVWTPAEDAFARPLYERGVLTEVIAESMTGRTASAISARASKEGWRRAKTPAPPRPPPVAKPAAPKPSKSNWDRVDMAVVRELYDAGRSTEAIAFRVGVPDAAIKSRIRELGWSRKGAGAEPFRPVRSAPPDPPPNLPPGTVETIEEWCARTGRAVTVAPPVQYVPHARTPVYGGGGRGMAT